MDAACGNVVACSSVGNSHFNRAFLPISPSTEMNTKGRGDHGYRVGTTGSMRIVTVCTACSCAQVLECFRHGILHRLVGGTNKKALTIKDRKVELVAAGTIASTAATWHFKGRMNRIGQTAAGYKMAALLMTGQATDTLLRSSWRRCQTIVCGNLRSMTTNAPWLRTGLVFADKQWVGPGDSMARCRKLAGDIRVAARALG